MSLCLLVVSGLSGFRPQSNIKRHVNLRRNSKLTVDVNSCVSFYVALP